MQSDSAIPGADRLDSVLVLMSPLYIFFVFGTNDFRGDNRVPVVSLVIVLLKFQAIAARTDYLS